MEDCEIVALFFERDERAIEETRKKCGKFVLSTALGILRDERDAAECENDAYLAAWNCIPPNKPEALTPFVGKIARRIAVNRLRASKRKKRMENNALVALSELEGCIADRSEPIDMLERKELSVHIDRFLRSLPETERTVFLRRYWYMESVKEISRRFNFTQGKTKMMLMRTRNKLKSYLERENVFI